MYKRDNFQELIEKANYSNITDLRNKVVVLRACLNVSVDKEGNITDRTRLNDAYPTIRELSPLVKKLIILGHLGRPVVKDVHLSFNNIAKVIDSQLNADLDMNCKFVTELDEAADSNERVVLVENIRFFPDEESNNENEINLFAKRLASLGDVFINDAFPDYRESASTYYITKYIPSYIGPNFIAEAKNLYALSNAQRPYIAVLGGAKLSEKLDTMLELLKYADKVIVGGAMAYTIMKAKGIETGNSLIEEDKIDVAAEMLKNYADKIVLPIDHYVASDFNLKEAEIGVVTKDSLIPKDMIAIDIGTKSIELFKSELSKAKTILMNGPMGVFEWPKSDLGTKEIYKVAANNVNAFSIIGGGDSISAVNKFRINGFEHISKGGGAMLAFIANNDFPILDIILDQYA